MKRLRDVPRNTILTIRNLLRSLRRKGLDCVVLPIHGSYPELRPRRDLLSLLPAETSLIEMRTAVEMIAGDRRVQTVVLRFGTLQAGMSTLYSLRRLLLDLRDKGKRLVAWMPSAATRDYYVASVCDEVILPPAGWLSLLGLRFEAIFLKDTLALAGIGADFEAIAEYKTAPDTFRRTTMTEPHREMLNAILDSAFDEIVAAIAEGRTLGPARVRELIDHMPLTPAEAIEAGLVDAVLYEDELGAYLSTGDDPVSLLAWRDAARVLRKPIKWSTRQRIGVVSLEGVIVPGRSRRIPAPLPPSIPFGTQAGADTIVQALRAAEADEHVKAVVFHVETSGGAALASDLIWREVRRLRERKPVVVLMGGQAASGGYYVAAPANRIVARPTTLTGSIGIWGGKFTLAGLYARLGLGHEAVQRGAMAGIYSETAPFSEKERERIRHELGTNYALFKSRVTEGRGMTEEQVEEIARGRVWTGAQAREIGLVDELGDLQTALTIAKELAHLDPEQEYTVVQVRPPRRTLLPPPFSGAEQGAESLGTAMLRLTRERVWALAPWMMQMRG
jgi:protease-4